MFRTIKRIARLCTIASIFSILISINHILVNIIYSHTGYMESRLLFICIESIPPFFSVFLSIALHHLAETAGNVSYISKESLTQMETKLNEMENKLNQLQMANEEANPT